VKIRVKLLRGQRPS